MKEAEQDYRIWKNKNLILRYGDMTDSSNILHILYEIKKKIIPYKS